MTSSFRLLLLASLALGCTAHAGEMNTLTGAEKSAGWQLLFDGKSLSGWRGYKTEQPVGWSVQQGTLVLEAGRKGDLVTLREYGDFELTFDWKISEGGNSGVLYRVGLGDQNPPRSGPEYQVLDNAKAKDNKIGTHHAGALYDLVAPAKDASRPAGQWNEARIRLQGWKVEHWLNGVKTATADLASPAGKALIAGSKFKAWTRYASSRAVTSCCRTTATP